MPESFYSAESKKADDDSSAYSGAELLKVELFFNCSSLMFTAFCPGRFVCILTVPSSQTCAAIRKLSTSCSRKSDDSSFNGCHDIVQTFLNILVLFASLTAVVVISDAALANAVFTALLKYPLCSPNGSEKRFFPDYQMMQSWLRLREGKNIQAHDLILLGHELEANIMNSDPSMYYEKAHKIAEQKYNYSEALLHVMPLMK